MSIVRLAVSVPSCCDLLASTLQCNSVTACYMTLQAETISSYIDGMTGMPAG